MKTTNAKTLIGFEATMADEWNTGKLPFLVHFSGGNEAQLIELFEDINPEDWIFSTHRNHYHYLLKGGLMSDLAELIRAGRSMFVYDKKLRFFTSSIVAGNCCIAAGVAEGIKIRGGTEQVWCFVGDAAEDQGHFYEAVIYSWGKGLPITFVIEDNDRNVQTTKDQRKGGFVIDWPENVIRYCYTPTYPHAGSGTKNKITFSDIENPWT